MRCAGLAVAKKKFERKSESFRKEALIQALFLRKKYAFLIQNQIAKNIPDSLVQFIEKVKEINNRNMKSTEKGNEVKNYNEEEKKNEARDKNFVDFKKIYESKKDSIKKDV